MSKPNTTEVDYEIVQAAFAMLATLDMLEDDGVFERLRLAEDQRRRSYHEQLMKAKDRLAKAIHAEADRRAEGGSS